MLGFLEPGIENDSSHPHWILKPSYFKNGVQDLESVPADIVNLSRMKEALQGMRTNLEGSNNHGPPLMIASLSITFSNKKEKIHDVVEKSLAFPF